MLHILLGILGVIITIVLVVGVHELGHFLFAKLSGIKVLRFSIGFGKKLISWHDKSGTEYVIAAIPLGGYVQMLDESEGNVKKHEKHLSFNHQPFYKKFAVIAAGPFFNLLFAFFIYWFLFLIGFTSVIPVIGKVNPNTIAEQAGLKPQQVITSIDNRETHSWMGVIVNILYRAGEGGSMQMAVKDPVTAKIKTYNLNLTDWHMDNLRPDPLASLGITPYEPTIPNVVGKILPDSPAAKAGLKEGDQIIAVNKQTTVDWLTLVEKFSNRPAETLNFTIKRNNKILQIPVKIGVKKSLFFQSQGYLGMGPAFEWPKKYLQLNKYGFKESAEHAWGNIVLFTKMNMLVLVKMLTGKISLASLGGPLTIFESAGTAINNGLIPFFSFLAFLSISIGIINVIPIPGLDGGHLLFQIIEFVTQRPLSQRYQLLLYRFGLIALFMLMAQALVNDLLRL